MIKVDEKRLQELLLKPAYIILNELEAYREEDEKSIRFTDLLNKTKISKGKFNRELNKLRDHKLIIKKEKNKGYLITTTGLNLLNSIQTGKILQEYNQQFKYKNILFENPNKFPLRTILIYLIGALLVGILGIIFLVSNIESFSKELNEGGAFLFGFFTLGIISGFTLITIELFKVYKDYKYKFPLPEMDFTEGLYLEFINNAITLFSYLMDVEQNKLNNFLMDYSSRKFNLFYYGHIISFLIWITLTYVYLILDLTYMIGLIFLIFCIELIFQGIINQTFKENYHNYYILIKGKIGEMLKRLELIIYFGINRLKFKNYQEMEEKGKFLRLRYSKYANTLKFPYMYLLNVKLILFFILPFILFSIHIPRIINESVYSLQGTMFIFIIFILLIEIPAILSKIYEAYKSCWRNKDLNKLDQYLRQITEIQESITTRTYNSIF